MKIRGVLIFVVPAFRAPALRIAKCFVTTQFYIVVLSHRRGGHEAFGENATASERGLVYCFLVILLFA